MKKKKFLLLESKNGGKPHTIGGVLVLVTTEEAAYVSSAKLEQGCGCTYFLSKDGSSQNLLEILVFRQRVPMQPDAVGPYIYELELKKPE